MLLLNKCILGVSTGFLLLLSGCKTTSSSSPDTTIANSEARNRLGYVRSKDTRAEYKKFDYQFSMDMDTSIEFKPIDKVDFNQCKINAAERLPTETMIQPCSQVIEAPQSQKKMRTASLYNRGLIFQKLGQDGPARTDFNAVLSSDDNFGDAELAIAMLELKAGNIELAQARIKKALEKKVRHPAYAHYLLGDIFERQSEFIAARSEYRTALQLKPNWRNVQKRIERINISWPENPG